LSIEQRAWDEVFAAVVELHAYFPALAPRALRDLFGHGVCAEYVFNASAL
jgi:hypothetical protein